MAWDYDWIWSLPLIVGTLVFHVIGLGYIAQLAERILVRRQATQSLLLEFAIAMGPTVLMATLLLAFDAVVWAATYRILGALPTTAQAMLYSLSAITSYGHADVFLEPKWQLMGAMEAVNGTLLFGLTTAFLFAVIQRVWPWKHDRRQS